MENVWISSGFCPCPAGRSADVSVPAMGAAASKASGNAPEDLVLVYFDLKGRGEASRLALHMANVPFRDQRITFEEWGALKKAEEETGTQQTGPLGQVPLLKFTTAGEEVTFCQSSAILRYVGRIAAEKGIKNFVGYPIGDAIACLQVDQALDSIEDTFPKMWAPIMREKDNSRKAELVKEMVEIKMPAALAKLDALIAATNGTDIGSSDTGTTTWLKDGKISIADLELYAFVETLAGGPLVAMLQTPKDICAPYKNVMGVWRGIKELNTTKTWDAKVEAEKKAPSS